MNFLWLPAKTLKNMLLLQHSRKELMLPLVVSVLLAVTPTAVVSQSTESTTGSTAATTAASPTSVTTIASVTLENTTADEPTTASITTPSPVTSSTTATTAPSTTPEGAANSPCNTTGDCQPNKNLECLKGTCHCSSPLVFDVRVARCVIPLGKQCDSSDIIGENMCPEFAECFMDRCVCKTGYSMHTLTRCKSDLSEANDERKPILMWPRQTAKTKQIDEKGSCTLETCDASKGLVCQNETCICKDSKEIFVEEFGRCLNTTIQKTLKDALSIVASSEDEIKSFIKLLEKFDDADQEIGGSDHYNSPVHQLLGLLGGGEYRDGGGSTQQHSQIAQPYSSYRAGGGDLHSAAQEPIADTALPSDGSNASGGSSGGEISSPKGGPEETSASEHDGHNHRISPVHAANAESSVESGEAMLYHHSGSQESIKKPAPSYSSLALDNLHYSPQAQEPQIVQRQAPPYLQGLGTIPGGNHFRLPIGYGAQGIGGYGGLGALGGLGGHDGGFGGQGIQGLQGMQGLGGYAGGHQPYGAEHQGYGVGGQQHGGYGDQHGEAQGGYGVGGGGGQHHGGDLLHLGRGQHHQPAPGGYGGHGLAGGIPGGGGHHEGHHEGHHGGPPGHHLEPQSGLLVDVAEFVGRSLKLIDRFLPLVHAINDVLKKEKVFDSKDGGGGLFGNLNGPPPPGGNAGGPEGPRGRRFGDISKEIDELKDGGDGTLKKLLT